MILDTINKQYKTILSHLQDEQSVRIFNSKVEYTITRNDDCLKENLFDINKSYSCQQIDNVLQQESDRPIVIWGCGACGIKTKNNLDKCQKDYNIVIFR